MLVFRSDKRFHGYSRKGFANLIVLGTNDTGSFLWKTAAFLQSYLLLTLFCHRPKAPRTKNKPRAGSSTVVEIWDEHSQAHNTKPDDQDWRKAAYRGHNCSPGSYPQALSCSVITHDEIPDSRLWSWLAYPLSS